VRAVVHKTVDEESAQTAGSYFIERARPDQFLAHFWTPIFQDKLQAVRETVDFQCQTRVVAAAIGVPNNVRGGFINGQGQIVSIRLRYAGFLSAKSYHTA